MSVLDASAILAFLQQEKGYRVVEKALLAGAVCSTANWSEVAQKVGAHGRDWDLARALLLGYDLELVPVTVELGELAASRWATTPALSLGGRLCLALGELLDRPVLTADRAWGRAGRVRQIR